MKVFHCCSAKEIEAHSVKVKPIVQTLAAIQALFRPLRAGETRQALCLRCRSITEKAPPSAGLDDFAGGHFGDGRKAARAGGRRFGAPSKEEALQEISQFVWGTRRAACCSGSMQPWGVERIVFSSGAVPLGRSCAADGEAKVEACALRTTIPGVIPLHQHLRVLASLACFAENWARHHTLCLPCRLSFPSLGANLAEVGK